MPDSRVDLHHGGNGRRVAVAQHPINYIRPTTTNPGFYLLCIWRSVYWIGLSSSVITSADPASF